MTEYGLVLARVATHHQDGVGLFQFLDGLAQKRKHRLLRLTGKVGLAQTMIDVGHTQPFGELVEKTQFLQRGARRRQHAELVGTLFLHPLGNRLGGNVQGFLPLNFLPAVGAFHHRRRQAIVAVDALVGETVTIRGPDFIDRFVLARHNTHQPAAAGMQKHIGANAIVRRYRSRLLQFPGTRTEAVGTRSQCPDRAHIDNVAGQFGLKIVLNIGTDFDLLAPAHATHLLDPGHVLQEAHTARTVNTAGHIGGDQRAEVLLRHHTFLFAEARNTATVFQRRVLQFAFAALVTDRTIQRVVDEQELHHRALRLAGVVGFRPHLHAVGDRCGAGRQRLGRHATAHFNLNHAHATVGGDRQLLVVTETRHADVVGVGDLDDRGALARLVLDIIDDHPEHVIGHGIRLGAHAAAPFAPPAR